jgi:hypothetical protein
VRLHRHALACVSSHRGLRCSGLGPVSLPLLPKAKCRFLLQHPAHSLQIREWWCIGFCQAKRKNMLARRAPCKEEHANSRCRTQQCSCSQRKTQQDFATVRLLACALAFWMVRLHAAMNSWLCFFPESNSRQNHLPPQTAIVTNGKTD